jgi:phosphomethylpyrimidine synthase
VRDYAATLNDPQKRAVAGETLREAGSAAGATGTQNDIEEGMKQMSKKFLDMGGEVYVDADKAKDSNKAL